MWLNSGKKWKLTIHMKPKAKGRPRFGKGYTYTPSATRLAEKELKVKIAANDPPKFTKAVAMNIVFTFKRPKSVNRIYPTVRPDLDNLVKLVTDSGNGLIYKDDCQIIQITTSKQYGKIDSISIVAFEI